MPSEETQAPIVAEPVDGGRKKMGDYAGTKCKPENSVKTGIQEGKRKQKEISQVQGRW
jgi:hypothetical protein